MKRRYSRSEAAKKAAKYSTTSTPAAPPRNPSKIDGEELFKLYLMHVDSYLKLDYEEGQPTSDLFPPLTIHALISQFRREQRVSSNVLDITKFDDCVVQQMNKYWVNVLGKGNNETFWVRQWEKHGKAQQVLKPKMFFKLALRVFKQIHIMEWLEEEGILPGMGKEYNGEVIKKAVEKHLKKKIEINCRLDIHLNQRIHHYGIFCNEFGDLRDNPWDHQEGMKHYLEKVDVTLEGNCSSPRCGTTS